MRAALVLSALAVSAAALAQQPAPGPPRNTITGLVLSSADVPLRRARVEVTVGRTRFDPILTDDAGRFAVPVTGTGPFVLTVDKAGYTTARTTLSREAISDPLTVRLPIAAAIAGTVVDADGQPQVSVAVVARRLQSPAGDSGPAEYTTMTDDRGEFRLGGLVRGTYELTSGSAFRSLTAGSQVSVSGTPEGGTMVIVQAERPGQGPTRTMAVLGPADVKAVPQVVTVDTGQEVTGLALVVDVSADTMLSAIARLVDRPGLSSSTPGRPVPAGIRGRVRSATGRPLGQALVRIASAGFDQSVTTRPDGTFSLFGLAAGEYTVEASAHGYTARAFGQERAGQAGRPIVLEESATVEDIDIVLPAGAAITGVIVDEHGDPLQGVEVQALRADFVSGRRTAVPAGMARRTNDRGEYRLFGLLPGTYLVAASIDGALHAARGAPAYTALYYPGTPSMAGAIPLLVAADTVADFLFTPTAGAPVRGMATDGRGPLVGGTAELVESRRSGSIVVQPRVVSIQSDGSFLFPVVPPGHYVVRVRGDGPGRTGLYGVAEVPIPDSTPVELTIPTSHGATLDGQVVVEGTADATRCPVPGPGGAILNSSCRGLEPAARFALTPIALDDHARESAAPFVVSGDSFFLSGLFGFNGFALRRAPGVEWFLKAVRINGVDVTDTGFDFGTAGGTISDAEIVVSRTSGILEGRVADAAAAVPDYFVVVFPPFRDQWQPHSRRLKFTRARSDGTFRLAGLPSGDYLVAAVDRVDGTIVDGEWQSADVLEQLAGGAQRVTVEEGETRALTLRLIRR